MRAIVHERYGGPEALRLEDRERPEPTADAVRVRVMSASVNAYDWHMLRGKPYMARASEGIRRPKNQLLGVDVAGIVVAVGHEVDDLAIGDPVFGARNGAFAEYVSGRTFVRMPAGLSFDEAAAVPTAGCTALQAIRDKGEVRGGERVLVTGAGGGVGTFAVQISKALGAEVTAETSSSKADLVRSLGADHILERGRHELAEAGPFDVAIDVAGGGPVGRIARVLTPAGTFVFVGPGHGDWLGPLAHLASGLIRNRLGHRRFRPFLASVTKPDLVVLRELIEAGRLRPVIDRTFPLSDAATAIAYVETGRAAGKVVIQVAQPSGTT